MIESRAPQLKTHIVSPGDYVAKIAYTYGVTEADILTLSQNGELFASRDPNILARGDLVTVPMVSRRTKQVQGGSTTTVTTPVPTVELRLTFTRFDRSLANEAYELHGTGAKMPVKGTTDGQGRATLIVPVTVNSVTVAMHALEYVFNLRVGFLEPASTARGAEQRLATLRYFYAPDDAPAWLRRARREYALRRFQEDYDLRATGVLDQATIDMLAEVCQY